MKKTLLAAILACAMPLAAEATSFTTTVTGSSGNLAASATFNFNDPANTLTVTLTNTSAADVLIPNDVLTAVLFTLNTAATPVSATIPLGTVLFGSDGGGNVGGEFAYNANGISSAGFGLFGNGNFGGPDLDPPDAVNGLNYGITSAGDNPGSGNAEVTGNVPLIKNSVVFVLNVPGDLTSISNVSFQYGTALTGPNVPGPGGFTVPDGGMTLSLLGLALGSLGLVSRRRA